ncbi:hypothetical protein HanXRQr2_Chr03g0087291 [Helianthus annuus]|uniref:Uncharacterized protein n=1 Tax=Helianthus annuus TaxID=4232 RepID=A0A9K3JDP9_HELAN|nr:hypothetical protein HanXRQr2_Chr03g0087291 [Helianthus annuus]KAJ0941760.1 hypothetical protein HanPSC8_Chr03g0083901 [Helianthus annuus]
MDLHGSACGSGRISSQPRVSHLKNRLNQHFEELGFNKRTTAYRQEREGHMRL